MVQVIQRSMAAQEQHWSDRQRALLLGIARRTLANVLVRQEHPQAAVEHAIQAETKGPAGVADEDRESLWSSRACFVTLWRRATGELRGCRGECSARQPLVVAVGGMALAAGLDDPRFAAVTAAELPELRIEISVLTPLQPVEPAQVEIGRHGLMIAKGGRRGLLLPQVAVEHHLLREQFLEAVCWKAGLPPDAWQRAGAGLWAFETESWSEV